MTMTDSLIGSVGAVVIGSLLAVVVAVGLSPLTPAIGARPPLHLSSEFGGKCGLFIRSIENLCREANKPLAKIDYRGLNLEASLKKLSFQILKLITAKRSVELHRLAIGEALNCPEVGEVWYTHGPAKTTSFIRSLLESRREELRKTTIPIDRIAVILHDSLTGDILYRRLAGVGKHENDDDLERLACAAVDLIFGTVYKDVP